MHSYHSCYDHQRMHNTLRLVACAAGLVPGPLGFTVVALVINNSLFLLSAVLLAM